MTKALHLSLVDRPSSQADQQQKSRLEQALRFGSAAVEASNDYVSDNQRLSSSAESSDEPSSETNTESLSTSS